MHMVTIYFAKIVTLYYLCPIVIYLPSFHMVTFTLCYLFTIVPQGYLSTIVIYLPMFHRVISLQNCYHVLCSIVIYLPSMHMVTCTIVTQLLPYTIVTYLKGYFKEYYFNDDLRLF